MGKCHNSIVVPAPIDKVWKTIRNFHDLSWAQGVIENLSIVGEASGIEIGAQRVLNGLFHEKLLTLSDLNRLIEYQITDGPGVIASDQVKNYIGRVRLHPVTSDDTTFVEWTSAYDSADDPAVGELCNPIYHALLAALQNHFATS